MLAPLKRSFQFPSKVLLGGIRFFTETKKPIPVVLAEEDLEESFVKGWGKGGQKVNKTSNCVVLLHKPSGISVKCHKTRYLVDNRKWARKMLKEQLDVSLNGHLSKKMQKVNRIKRRAARNQRRRRVKEKGKIEQEQSSLALKPSLVSVFIAILKLSLSRMNKSHL